MPHHEHPVPAPDDNSRSITLTESLDLTAMSVADRHRAVAARFGELVRSTSDWSDPTPVAEWSAGDIVRHLLDWFPGFLAGGGVPLREARTSVDEGLPAAWAERTAEIQALLDEVGTATRPFVHPFAGTHALGDAVDRFFTADLFMHTWDLARAVGGDDRLDPFWSRELLDGLRAIEPVLRSSGHYGPAVEVDPTADAVDQLMGFIGRDPGWRRPSSGRSPVGDR